MKGVGMLVVSLRGVNFGFGVALGVLGKPLLYLAVKVFFRVAVKERLKNYIFSIPLMYSIHVIKV